MNLYIADLLPAEPKPTPKDVELYQLKGEDLINLTNLVSDRLHKFIV